MLKFKYHRIYFDEIIYYPKRGRDLRITASNMEFGFYKLFCSLPDKLRKTWHAANNIVMPLLLSSSKTMPSCSSVFVSIVFFIHARTHMYLVSCFFCGWLQSLQWMLPASTQPRAIQKRKIWAWCVSNFEGGQISLFGPLHTTHTVRTCPWSPVGIEKDWESPKTVITKLTSKKLINWKNYWKIKKTIKKLQP